MVFNFTETEKMRNILLPTDFSDNAWSAAVYASYLYAEVECKFYFLHSLKIKASTMSNLSNRLMASMTDNAIKDLKELKSMAERSTINANHEFEIILSTANLCDAIETTIKKYSIDLIIMGTKGATGAKEFFFGSNTVNILKKMRHCPVFIVPDEFDFRVPKQIAFPTDFNRPYGEELNALIHLAELYNPKIRIVYIRKKDKLSKFQDNNKDMLKLLLKNHEQSLHWIPDYDSKTNEIKDFIEELNIDILVMLNYKHSVIENILNEPVVKRIGYHPTIPFLVIPCDI